MNRQDAIAAIVEYQEADSSEYDSPEGQRHGNDHATVDLALITLGVGAEEIDMARLALAEEDYGGCIGRSEEGWSVLNRPQEQDGPAALENWRKAGEAYFAALRRHWFGQWGEPS